MRNFVMLKWLWLSLLAVILDQASKLVIAGSMRLYESIEIMPFFKLTYVHNTGAAFSFLSEAGGWQRWFFCRIGVGDQRGDSGLADPVAETRDFAGGGFGTGFRRCGRQFDRSAGLRLCNRFS